MQVNTLLIVESPTVERVIAGFSIPGLDVASTSGYSWKPRPDFKKGTLTGIAGQELLPFRKAIRMKARNAGRVILATDSDPSGRFIAACLARDLGKKQLFRCYLNVLSPQGVAGATDHATAWQPEDVQPLLNRLYVNDFLRKASCAGDKFKAGNHALSLVKLALFPYFFALRKHSEFCIRKAMPLTSGTGGEITRVYETAGNARNSSDFNAEEANRNIHNHHAATYIPEIPVDAAWDTYIRVRWSGETGTRYRICHPWNTATFISRFTDSPCPGDLKHSGSFTQTQDLLNRLFTTMPEAMESGLITYPRTVADGFYRATWEQACEYQLRKMPAEALLPTALWKIIPDDFPHEALRPIRIGLTTQDVRPFLRKNLFEAYRVLHSETTAVFRQPVPIYAATVMDSSGRQFICDSGMAQTKKTVENSQENSLNCSVLNVQQHGSRNNLQTPYQKPYEVIRPRYRMENLLEWLAHTAMLPPSRFGAVIDQLISGNWIVVTGRGQVGPGPTLIQFSGLTGRTSASELGELLESLQRGITDSRNTAELVPLLDRMMAYTAEKTHEKREY